LNFLLRQATLDDVKALAELNAELIADEAGGNRLGIKQLQVRMTSWLKQRRYSAILIESTLTRHQTGGMNVVPPGGGHNIQPLFDSTIEANQEVLGYLVFRKRKEEYDPEAAAVFIRQFFIRTKWRRQGIGSEAFRRIVAEYFPQGANIWLEVLEHNKAAIAFWKAVGFSHYSRIMKK